MLHAHPMDTRYAACTPDGHPICCMHTRWTPDMMHACSAAGTVCVRCLITLLTPHVAEHALIACLSDDEAVKCADGFLVGALEPALVANLGLEDPQLAAGHQRLDQMVLATLVTVSCERGGGPVWWAFVKASKGDQKAHMPTRCVQEACVIQS
jgi:hypothetical protein